MAYQTGIKTFIQFLLLQGLVLDCSRLPYTTENNLSDFVGYCFQHLKLKYSSIKLYLCDVKYGYLMQGNLSSFDYVSLKRFFMHF